jgi:hypothetical protein
MSDPRGRGRGPRPQDFGSRPLGRMPDFAGGRVGMGRGPSPGSRRECALAQAAAMCRWQYACILVQPAVPLDFVGPLFERMVQCSESQQGQRQLQQLQ